jgi:outer membrane translocation and assembly module TamA
MSGPLSSGRGTGSSSSSRGSDPPARVTFRPGRLLAAGAVLGAAACLQPPPPPAGPYASFLDFAGREVEEVEILGEQAVPEDSLRSVLATRPSRCGLLFLPACPFGIGRSTERLDVEELARDVERIRLLHRSFGYYGTRVAPDGEPFGIDEFAASADTLRAALLSRGYLYAQVLRNYAVDTVADVAQVRFRAVPGPRVRVDTVLVLGAKRLDRETVLRQLAFREGDVLVPEELNRSQWNLYELGIVGFASVQLAPDSLQLDPDSARATVVVRVVETPKYLAEASAGYGTLDCLRARGGSWTTTSWAGRASWSSQAPSPSWGSESRSGRGWSGASAGRWRTTASATRSTTGSRTERASEVGRFLRVSRGGQLSVAREVAGRDDRRYHSLEELDYQWAADLFWRRKFGHPPQ